MKKRKFLAGFILSLVVFSLAYIFWQVELRYIKPTPVPVNYKEVYVNDLIYVDDTLTENLKKPVFYHFFTTNCPCSRFNLTHFNYLKTKYSSKFDFYVVIPEEDDISKARPYFNGVTKIIKDKNKAFAIRSGVYSTPQAVVINTDHTLYYRGNYNKARYCIDPRSNFAQMALDSLIADTSPPDFGPLSSIAYGCGIDEDNYSLTNIF